MKLNFSIKPFLWGLLFFLPLHLVGQDMERAKATLRTLCSPAFHGRGYVNGGDRIAATYIRGQFQEIGLKPFDSSFFRPFTIEINTFPKKVSLQLDHQKLEPGKDFIVNPVAQGGRGRGKIVLLDTLIFTSENARKTFMQQNFKRNVMVYESRHFSKLTELPLDYLNKMHEAKALIELQKDKLTASVSTAQQSHAAFEMVKKDLNPASKTAKFRLDAKFIKNYQTQNVIGYVTGKTNPDSYIVLTAHYDHLGRMGKDTYFPGANDNASGTTMLLELARYYARPENQPDESIVFMAFAAEEAGLLGSKYYTEHPVFPLKQIKFLLNLDLMGTGEDGITVVNSLKLPDEFAILTRINSEKNYLTKVNKRDNAPNSDHYFFTRKGVKAFFIYAMGGPKFYHDIYDRPETLPLTKFQEMFGLITDFVKEL
jgi:hypothetical protein